LKQFFQKIHLPKVTQEQNSLSKTISEKEVYKHINKLNIDKSPGSDGYTNEFHEEFQHDLVPLLCKAFNWALENESWPATWNCAIITVLHKSGKNPTEKSDLIAAKIEMVKLLKAEVEKSLSILMKRTFDGGPRALNY
uniref:Uncharacterized protein n=1 Tax=Scophthalmus maximus TaxID=52904 RepID=A0A8D3DNQ3_SCOMX